MFPREVQITDPVEALIVEQALAMARELKQVCRAAPDGEVLGEAEKVAVARGRELTRKSLEVVLNHEAHELEKKGRAAAPAPASERGNIAADRRDRS